MATIIELDDALPPDKKVRLAGKVYTLPGDIPTPLFLRIQRATQNIAGDEGIENLSEAIVDLFRTRDASIVELPLGLAQMVTLFSTVYGAPDEEEPDEARPTKPTRGTGTGSRAGTGTRSRS